MAESGSIYSAVYSGVPVFEMLVNGVAVMRRRTDSYMNATQILKVANIDKGKRTKILEKEVLTGEHEKVQGGYGKYQGTWIPCSRSKELADRYGVFDLLAPIFNFQLDTMGIQNGEEAFLTKEQAIVANKKKFSDATKEQHRALSSASGDDSSLPARKRFKAHEENIALTNSLTSSSSSKSYQPPAYPPLPSQDTSSTTMNTDDNASNTERHRSVLMSIFLSDRPDQIPDLLKNNHCNINLDVVIDEQGNTALHWATSLARTKTVEFLVSHGANIACTNYSGETPLIRGVMVTNNYDNHSFATVFGLLKESLPLLDNKKRSVLHHCALTSGIQGRRNAAIHYMEVLAKEEETKEILDAQDSLGDTPLAIAVRLDCQPLVDILKELGAKQYAQNHIGLQVSDYQRHDDLAMEDMPQELFTNYAKKSSTPTQRGKEIIATVQKIVDALDNEYGAQLATKENELSSLQADLNTVTQELERTRKCLEQRQSQSQKLSEAQQRAQNIEQALQAGWDRLRILMLRANKPMPQPQEVDQFDPHQDIDAFFDVPQLHYSEDATEEQKKSQLESYIKNVQAKVKAYRMNDQVLVGEIEKLQKKFIEKELQCKRLIAACCNLPMDKIDDLVEPLTLAIESDPPDLDLARVIGFMDKIRRQGAFTGSSDAVTTSGNNGGAGADGSFAITAPPATTTTTTEAAAVDENQLQYQYANTSSLRSPQPEKNENNTTSTTSIQQ